MGTLRLSGLNQISRNLQRVVWLWGIFPFLTCWGADTTETTMWKSAIWKLVLQRLPFPAWAGRWRFQNQSGLSYKSNTSEAMNKELSFFYYTVASLHRGLTKCLWSMWRQPWWGEARLRHADTAGSGWSQLSPGPSAGLAGPGNAAGATGKMCCSKGKMLPILFYFFFAQWGQKCEKQHWEQQGQRRRTLSTPEGSEASAAWAGVSLPRALASSLSLAAEERKPSLCFSKYIEVGDLFFFFFL